MLLSFLLSGESIQDVLISLLLSLPIILFSLSIHETAHGWVAWKLGDPTAHNQGRLSLNPLKHMDPIGALCMLLVGFGWAKPVPINVRYFRNPKRGMAICGAAGPVANLLVGLLFALLYGICLAGYSYFYYLPDAEFAKQMMYWLFNVCYLGAYMNFFLMVFNLLPVPPFDGSRILFAFLPPKQYFGIMRYERQIMLGVLVVLLACSYVFHFSPFGWVADNLTDLVATPVTDLLWKHVFHPRLMTKLF